LIIFVTKETAARFAGKQLHYAEGAWFFLRAIREASGHD